MPILQSEQLPQHLRRGLQPLYTIFGDAPLLALEAADRIRAQAKNAGYAEREVLTAEQHFDWSRLKNAAQTQSLFATQRILELRIPSGKPGIEGGKALQAFCAALPADTLVLIALGEIERKAQQSAWFKALENAGIMIEAAQVPRAALPAWLQGRLQLQAQHGDDATLQFLADRVEGNLLAAHQELQKLALLFPPGALTFEQVKDAVLDVARYDVFDIGALTMTGDLAHLTRALDGLQGEGAATPLILWSITEEIRALGKVLALMQDGKPLPQALRDARVFGPRQKLIERHAPRFKLRQIEAAIAHTARIDRMIKGLIKGDVWDEFLRLGMRFARVK